MKRLAAALALCAGLWSSGLDATGPAVHVVDGRGSALAEVLAVARPGDRVEVDGGRHTGPFTISQPVHLVGENRPILDGGGSGSVLTNLASGTVISGFDIVASGQSSTREDSGISSTGTLTVVDCRIDDVLFGIRVKVGPGSVIRGNTIRSRSGLDPARRGDGIRLWESHGSVIEANRVLGGRDVVFWYSSDLAVRGNRIEGGRYGLHTMYTNMIDITDNSLHDNSVGVYLMYSSGVRIAGNAVTKSFGPSGYGVALKDVEDFELEANSLSGNRVGLYLDNSPARQGSLGVIRGNTVAYNDIGVFAQPAVRGNRIGGNNFIDNTQQVALTARGSPGGNDWTPDGEGNYWSDYAGFDADGDGRGDLAYASAALFDTWLVTQPNLRLFLGSPAALALDAAARAFPVFQPEPVVVDTAPLTRPVAMRVRSEPASSTPLATLSAALLVAAAGAAAWGGRLESDLTAGGRAGL